jgi:hypothetical protein
MVVVWLGGAAMYLALAAADFGAFVCFVVTLLASMAAFTAVSLATLQ